MDIKIVTASYLQFTKSKADKRWASVFWNRVCLLNHRKSSPRMGVDHCHWTWYAQCYPTQTAQPPGTPMPDTSPPPRPLPALRHLDRVSNSELTIPEDSASGRAARRAWWAGYLTSFCKNWQTKGLLKDRASNRNALHGGLGYLEAGLGALLFLHPILPAKSWDHWAAVKGMLKPFSRVRVNTSKKQYGSLAYSSCCPLIKPQGACWK